MPSSYSQTLRARHTRPPTANTPLATLLQPSAHAFARAARAAHTLRAATPLTLRTATPPAASYAYTLSGHEYSANDDFEKAMACYRSAIRIDERHYNAWYGLGNIYYRQEKYDFSEHHLRKALGINPCSSPLYCYLGMALHANQKTMQALEMLSNAITIDPKNPLARFQKAQVLLSTDQNELALAELKQLVEMAPKEGSVYFVLGKVYKKLGDQSKAMVHLTRAVSPICPHAPHRRLRTRRSRAAAHTGLHLRRSLVPLIVRLVLRSSTCRQRMRSRSRPPSSTSRRRTMPRRRRSSEETGQRVCAGMHGDGVGG